MSIQKIKLYGTTATGGALTVTSDHDVLGKLVAVDWIDGTLSDGVDAVLTTIAQDDLPAKTLLTLTDANSDARYYPQTPAQDNAGADVTFDGTNEIYTEQIVNGKLSLAVTSGGDAKVGGCIVYVEC